MIKELLKILLKYFIVFLSVLALFLLSMMAFHILPLLKLKLNDDQSRALFKLFLIPSFYHSFYNALIISICLFGVSTLNYQKKYRIIAFFIPLVLSTFLVYLFLNNFNPKQKDLAVSQFDDPRLYFSNKTFFEYNNVKYYFDEVQRARIYNIAEINSGNISFYDYANCYFDKDNIILEFFSLNGIKKVNFLKDFFSGESRKSAINKTFYSLIYNITHNFLSSNDINSNIYLWFCISFFLLALTITAKIKNYPLLSIIYSLLFLIFFYYIFDSVIEVYNKFSIDFIRDQNSREMFFSSVVLFFGILIYSVHLLLLKSHHWED